MNAKGILKKTFAIILLFLAIMATLLVVLVNLNAEKTNIGAAVVLSGSMEPTLSVNDIIIFAKQESYKAGDIVVFSDDGIKSVHRIVKNSPKQIITKGDYNNAEDLPITKDQIYGKVRIAIPKLGAIFSKAYGANAKYVSQNTVETSLKMKKKEVKMTASVDDDDMFITVPRGGSQSFTKISIQSPEGEKRKLNLRLKISKPHSVATTTFKYKKNNDPSATYKTLEFDKNSEQENLLEPFEIAEDENFDITGTIYISAPRTASKYTYYEYTIYADMTIEDAQGNVIATKSIRLGKVKGVIA